MRLEPTEEQLEAITKLVYGPGDGPRAPEIFAFVRDAVLARASDRCNALQADGFETWLEAVYACVDEIESMRSEPRTHRLDSALPIPGSTGVVKRLIAAGFEQAEISLFVTKDHPFPVLRFRGAVTDGWIVFDMVDGGAMDLEKIEALAMEKLRERMAEKNERP